MIKQTVDNPRYPHYILITRLVVDDNPFDEDDRMDILYKGVGHSFTDTTTIGDAKMDTNRRKASIPVRFDQWKQEVSAGDTICVKRGNIVEKGIIRDWEPDNNRTLIYWELPRN
jgi:hypothetical protein